LELAIKSREFPAGARNSVAAFVAPEQRRLLLGPSRSLEEKRQPIPFLSPADDSIRAEDAVVADVLLSSFSTVALLSGPLQDANKRLLSGGGFGPLVWTSLENLEEDLARNADVCACIIDGSVLQTLDLDAQKRLFSLLGTYSTFLWIRVEERYLKMSHAEIRGCLRTARCMRDEIPAALLSIQADGTLREREVDDIAIARRALQARDEAQFIPGELTANQAQVLMAAAKLHAGELQLEGPVELKSLETRFLPGGKSNARIAVIRLNQGGYPIVAKVDKKEALLDEMRRFRTFIGPWDNELRPKLHFHSEAAVLLFGLIRDDRDPSRPAEMLDTRLEELWNAELFASRTEKDQMEAVNALAEGVEVAARKLGELNCLKPHDSRFPPLGNPEVGVLEKLTKAGIDWGLPATSRVALSKAKTRFNALESTAIVHGDVHLKNILLRADHTPYLIDYAGSGPGHPCVDLVRLELALFLGPLRQIESEETCADYQTSLTFDGASSSDLEKRFANLYRCHVNVVCLRGGVAARDEALAVLMAHGGDVADYQAAKFLVAWQNLVMMGRHTGLARAIIAALSPRIATW